VPKMKCPSCGIQIPKKQTAMLHYHTHVIRSEKGDYSYSCGCGKQDGYWDLEQGAAVALVKHFADSHGMSLVQAMGM
jgi:hypothetical protein